MKYTGKATPDTVNIDVLEKIPIKLLVKRGDLFNELEDPVFLDERVQERVYALYAMTYARTPTPKLHPSKRLHKYNYGY